MIEAAETKPAATASPEPKKRVLKIKASSIVPTDIVDCWRLYQSSLKNSRQPYPDLSGEDPSLMRSCLFAYISSPMFAGFIVRVGKKPVGMILADVQTRPFGAPHAFAFVWTLWVEPEYRKEGVGKMLWAEFRMRFSKAGIRQWEAWSNVDLTQVLEKATRGGIHKLMDRIGGGF